MAIPEGFRNSMEIATACGLPMTWFYLDGELKVDSIPLGDYNREVENKPKIGKGDMFYEFLFW